MTDFPKTDWVLLNRLFGNALLWPDDYSDLLVVEGRRRILSELGV